MSDKEKYAYQQAMSLLSGFYGDVQAQAMHRLAGAILLSAVLLAERHPAAQHEQANSTKEK